MPLASTTHMSLVEVSPSTVTRLKVRATTSWRASLSISWVMAQSVVTKASMVPMLGWIMPEPLAMAPRRTSLPPMVRETAISFFTVSVVMMAWAAVSEPSADRAAAAWGSPAWMAEMLMVWPMTPVLATTKSPGSRPVAAAAAVLMASAFSWLWGQQALALPLLATTPQATPFSRWSMVTYRGAAFTRFMV